MKEEMDPRLTSLLNSAKCYRYLGRDPTMDCFDVKDMSDKNVTIKDLKIVYEDLTFSNPISTISLLSGTRYFKIYLIVSKTHKREFLTIKSDFEEWATHSLNLSDLDLSHTERSYVHESPYDYGPHMYLPLEEVSSQESSILQGFLVHDMVDCNFEDFWLANITIRAPYTPKLEIKPRAKHDGCYESKPTRLAL